MVQASVKMHEIMRKKCCLGFVLAFVVQGVHAQSPIRGKVLDAAGNPMHQAGVSLLNSRDSTVIYHTRSDTAGNFLIMALHLGDYLIRAEVAGMPPAHVPFTTTAEVLDTTLQPIKLPQQDRVLNNVMKTGRTWATHVLGQKQYELTNHLGNVMATVSDKHHPRDDNSDGFRDRFHSEIQAAYDYYPYGMLMPDRFISDTGAHSIKVIKPVLIPRFTQNSVPLTGITAMPIPVGSYVSATTWAGGPAYTAYGISGGMLKNISVTPGAVTKITANIPYMINLVGMWVTEQIGTTTVNLGQPNYLWYAGNPPVTFTPTTNNVTLHIELLAYYNSAPSNGLFTLAGIQVESNGFVIENALVTLNSKNTDKYEFGMNQQMKTNEIAGIGNWMTAKFWEYGSREVQRKNPDPVRNPSMSPYAVFNGNPIRYSDVLGDVGKINVREGSEDAPKVVTLTYGLAQDGKSYVFYRPDGGIYEGKENFVNEVSNAITRIAATKTGKDLVNYLMTRPEVFYFGKTKYSAINKYDHIMFNPSQTRSGFDQNGSTYSPSWLILAHEMSHRRSEIDKVILPAGNWVYVGSTQQPASWDEINATHVENKIRAENNMPLRTHYSSTLDEVTDIERPDENSSLLQWGNPNRSKYYNESENVNYKGLKKDEKGYQYYEKSIQYDGGSLR